MNTTSTNDNEKQLAAGYAVLARCWREPDADLVAAIETGDLDEVATDIDTVSLDALRIEYTRLFVGPAEPPCPPYESVYRDEGGQVLGPMTRAVVTWYRSYDLEPDVEVPELPDHIGTELEFLGCLYRENETEAAKQFLEEHPREWIGQFLNEVREATDDPFYAALADTTERVIEPLESTTPP